jgi:hypothetical protein
VSAWTVGARQLEVPRRAAGGGLLPGSRCVAGRSAVLRRDSRVMAGDVRADDGRRPMARASARVAAIPPPLALWRAMRSGIRPAMASKPIVLRLELDTLARVDALAPQFSTKARDATRSEILRALIMAGLESAERDVGRDRLDRPALSGGLRLTRPAAGS